MSAAADLERNHPHIPWRKPIPVSIMGIKSTHLFACRFCIALHGLKASEADDGDTSYDGIVAHIEKEHP